MAAGLSPGGQNETVLFDNCCGDRNHGVWVWGIMFFLPNEDGIVLSALAVLLAERYDQMMNPII
jgi:hypothetical protein